MDWTHWTGWVHCVVFYHKIIWWFFLGTIRLDDWKQNSLKINRLHRRNLCTNVRPPSFSLTLGSYGTIKSFVCVCVCMYRLDIKLNGMNINRLLAGQNNCSIQLAHQFFLFAIKFPFFPLFSWGSTSFFQYELNKMLLINIKKKKRKRIELERKRRSNKNGLNR